MSILHHFNSIDLKDLRKEVEQHLQWSYAHSHISIEELERRLEILNRMEDKTAMLALVEDLPAPEGDPVIDSPMEEDGHGDSYFAFLGSQTRRGPWDVPRQLDVAAVLGSQLLDFREARFFRGTTVIKVFTFMGSVEMTFPPGVRVTSKGMPILGSIENKVQSETDGPLIHIEGFALLGNITARTKK